MRTPNAAFSLLETLVATAIIAGIATVAFQLFHQNERLFRDQSLILEMQQGARVIVSQVNEDVRRAGQGIPPGIQDLVLPGSSESRLNLRTSLNAVESVVISVLPLPVTNGTASTVFVESTPGFSAGREVFLWTDLAWARGSVDFVSGSAQSVRLTPTHVSSVPLEFAARPTLSLDEAVSIFWDATAKAVRRTTATSTANPANPSWAPANELAANVAELKFIYFDAAGVPVIPETFAERSKVRAIQVRVVVRSSATLSDGTRPTYAVSTGATPRNLRTQ